MRRLLVVIAALSALMAGLGFAPASAQVDTSHDPIGFVDDLWTSGGVVRGQLTWAAAGWVADPDDDKSVPDRASRVVTTVDGIEKVAAAPQHPRPDVSAVFPFVKQPVGWTLGFGVPDDGRAHEICIVAKNTGPGRDVALRCQTIRAGDRDGGEPVGHVDSVTVRPGLVRFTGWAGDPDGGTSATPVRLMLNGFLFDGWGAENARPDVDAARPDLGNAGGFDGTIALPPGRYSWCLVGENFGPRGLGTGEIGCGVIDVPGPTGRVLGSLDVMQAQSGSSTGGRAVASGWAWDPVARTVPAIRLHLIQKSSFALPGDSTWPATTGFGRSDVPAVVAGAPSDSGWVADAVVAKLGDAIYGCAYAVVDGTEELIGCRAVVVRQP